MASSESSMDIFKNTNTYEVLSTKESRSFKGKGPFKPSHKKESTEPSFVPIVTHTREEKDRLI